MEDIREKSCFLNMLTQRWGVFRAQPWTRAGRGEWQGVCRQENATHLVLFGIQRLDSFTQGVCVCLTEYFQNIWDIVDNMCNSYTRGIWDRSLITLLEHMLSGCKDPIYHFHCRIPQHLVWWSAHGRCWIHVYPMCKRAALSKHPSLLGTDPYPEV